MESMAPNQTGTASELGLIAELQVALKATPPSVLADWGKRTGERFLRVGAKRVTGIVDLATALTKRSADELVALIEAGRDGRLPVHLEQRLDTGRRAAEAIVGQGKAVFDLVATKASTNPSEAATHLCSLVIGFYTGSGGNGDGGIPDLDLLAGIGAHRSIFTHSIIAGAFVETAVLSLIDLVGEVHGRLPTRHSVFWDTLLRHSQIGGSTFVSGASVGISTHLGIDTLVDGFTPYKDFPISLPQGAHELLMGMNAVAEGVYGVRRYSGDFNAFLNDLTLRTSDHAEAKMTHAQLELESDTTPNASEIFYNRFRNATAEYRLDLIEELMQRYSALLAIDFTSVASQLAEARKKIEQAHAPFQLGVAGEFRVGKSTLINALIGQEVAFTDFLEATPIRCQFRRAETPSATLHYIDGTSEEMEFDRANELISDRRDDDSWTDSVLKMEYRVQCDALADTDLWDAPGLGGRDVNDTRALEHLDRLGGIIWVVDATMIGKASVASPIVRMHAAGKPLICVLNRIDETEGDPEELCEWMRTAFPGVFMAIVPFSALEALSECAHGKLGAGSRRLWTAIISAMGDSSEKGRAVRVQRTAEQELKRIIGRLTPLRRHMQDRIGLIKHYESELYTSRESLLESVPGILREQTELAFSRLTSELFNAISQSRDQASHPIDRVLTLIGDRRTHSALTENVLRESISRISDNWRTLSGNSLKFSAAAIPVGSIGMPKLYSPEVIFNGGRLGQKAIDSGVYAGGLTAIITGTIAVVSTAITWPVILAALPVGALQAWKRQKEIGPSQADIYSELNRLVAMLKSAFLEQVVPVVRANISRALESEVRELVSVERRSVLGNAELESSRRFISDLQNLEEVSTGARAMVTDRWTANEVFRLMDDPGERLDIVVTDLAFSLAPLLRRLPSSTEVRLIFPSRGEPKSELEERVAKAFGTWAGKRSVRSVASLDTAKEIVLETMLLTSDYCLVSRQDLSDVLDDCGTFVELSEGRTVGQNRFASLWQGLPVHGSQIVVTPVL